MAGRIGLVVWSAILFSMFTVVTSSHGFRCQPAQIADDFQRVGAPKAAAQSGPLLHAYSPDGFGVPRPPASPGLMPPENNPAPVRPGSLWASESGPAARTGIVPRSAPKPAGRYAEDRRSAEASKGYGTPMSGYAPMVPPDPRNAPGRPPTLRR